MADSVVGILLQVDADPSSASAALNSFSTEVSTTVPASAAQGFGAATEEAATAEKAILSARESTMLLSEELGVHLPRAVTGAIGNILPNINMIGPALLGVFAGIEIIKAIEALGEKFYDVADAEKEITLEANENKTAMAEAAKSSEDYAKSQIKLLSLQIANLEASKDITEEHGVLWDVLNIGLGQTLRFYDETIGKMQKVGEADQESYRLQKLRDDMLKILGKDLDEDAKKKEKYFKEQETREREASEADKRAAARRDEKIMHHATELDRINEYALTQRNEDIAAAARAEKEIATMEKKLALESQELQFKALLDSYKASDKALNDEEERGLAIARQRFDQFKRNETALRDGAANAQQEKNDLAEIGMEQRSLTQLIQLGIEARAQGIPILQAFKQAMKDEGDAAQQSAQQQTIANLESIGQMILGRKLYAEVETIVQSAEGFASLAELDFWGAAQHFTSAAEWGLVAGTSGRGGSGGGGGGGGGGASARVNSGGGARPGGDRGGGGAYPGGGPSVHLNFYGPVVAGHNSTQELFDQWSSAIKSGTLSLTATNALTNGAKGT